MPDSVSAACRVIRIGTFKFINAPNARASTNAPNATTPTDLADNLHLHPHHFTIKLPDRPEIQVDSTEIRQIFTFFGRELPRALVCVLVTPRLAESVTAALLASGCSSVEFRPASKDVAEKFIVLFPSDESSFEFQLLGDKFVWFSQRISLRTHEARELVLATAGRKKTVSFLRDIPNNDTIEDEEKSETIKVKEEQIKSVDNNEGTKSSVHNERTVPVSDDKVKSEDKNQPILLSPIFATPGAVKLLTRREMDHLALARTGKSVLRKRGSEGREGREGSEGREGTEGREGREGTEEGIVKVKRKDEVGDIDAVSDHSEIFTVPLCDLDKNGMYVEENTSEVVIENTGNHHIDDDLNTNGMIVEEDSSEVVIDDDTGVYFEEDASEVVIENTAYVGDFDEYGVIVQESHSEVVIDSTDVEANHG